MFRSSFITTWAHALASLPVIGLDLSDLSVKFIRFDERGKSIGVRYIGSADLAGGVMVNGSIEKPKELAGILANLKTNDGHKVTDRFVVASLPEEKGFIKILRIPRPKSENIDAAVRWELEGAIPLPVEEIYFDFEEVVSAGHSDHVDVLVLAYPRGIVDSYTSVLREAGYVPMALELESQAIARALIDRGNLDPVLIIDIGATRTSFVLMTREGIIHTSTMSVSGQSFEAEIAKAMNVSLERARELKVTAGLDLKKEGGNVARALMQPLRLLLEEIMRHIEFYRDHKKDRGDLQNSIEKILLTGGDSNLIGIESYISRGVKVTVEKVSPFSRVLPQMGQRLPPIPANQAHAYTTAIGLALRQIL
ncbi:MAG: type IV pilus assembly protein PilM [Candidatus Sungbacteria bacterium]|uniref:Type IV pilus assembly protein PilM n=1 Tax=Candidatus Sungiibacteriota bacterium TaxID=2750080 RepID=A0A931SD52_9BACT|nr:type IV pilus assembly protein PilM [Candidatus Sungbacteria bacterium]